SYLEVIRADGRGPRRLSPKVADLTPAWSPDSRSIAFSRVQHRGRDATVWSIHADGNHLRKLGSGFWPAWSPDGRTIAYGHLGRIESVRSDGSHRRVLLAEGSMPAWSPDGSRLAFSVGGEPTRVFVFDRKALEVRRVAYGFWPTWSSDGSQIGYTRGLFA